MKLPTLVLLFTVLLFPTLADRVRLTNEHVDLQVIFAPAGTNALALVYHDEDHELTHAATNAIVVVPESAKVAIPADFPELGPAGSDLWVLPASQVPGLPHLGISAEGLADDVPAQPVDFFVRRVEGPGHFLAWQLEGEGAVQLDVDSRDGLSASDKFMPFVGGHEHHNLGFTTNGLFTLWLQARATVDGTNIWSAETPFQFAVEPLPTLTPFQQWQADHWPGVTDPATIAPMADPDGDGEINLLEYAQATDPTVADRQFRPVIRFVNADGSPRGSIQYRRSKAATDVEITAEAASQPDGPWETLTNDEHEETFDSYELVTTADKITPSIAPHRFYRLRVEFR